MRTFRRCIAVPCPWQVVEFCFTWPSMRGRVERALLGTSPARDYHASEMGAAAMRMLERCPDSADTGGELSPAEAALVERPTFRLQRENLRYEHYAAQHARQWYEQRLRECVRAGMCPAWEDIDQFAQERAREHHTLKKLEEMGWRP